MNVSAVEATMPTGRDTETDLPGTAAAVPVTGWDTPRDQWLTGRRGGIGGSDVAAALGCSRNRSPWEVWREKTGRAPIGTEVPSPAAELGNALEPWLIDQATDMIGEHVRRTRARTYAHPEHRWRRCSPDGILSDGRLVEVKTAGLASGFGTPPGWADDRVPLGYEFQVRWSMHVMASPAVEVIALVAGLGLVRRTITRDAGIEHQLVRQLSAWWHRYVIADTEPPLNASDAAVLADLYPNPQREAARLDDTDAAEHWEAYLAARERESAAKADKEAAGAAIKALMGDAAAATIEGATIATWGTKKGAIAWRRLLADLAPDLETHSIPVPDPEDYRGKPGRSFSVKEIR